MAWTLRGQNTHVVTSGTGTNNLTLPGPPQTGDIVVVACACDFALPAVGGSIGVNAASGYSNAGHPNDANIGLQVGVKVMGGTPDTTVGVVARGGDNRSIVVTIQVWTGGDTTTPQDATATTAVNSSGQPDSPSITTSNNGALILSIGAADDQNTASALTAPSGYTNLTTVEAGAPVAESVTLGMASKTQATAGAENPGAYSGATSDYWSAVTVALRPSGGGVSGATGSAAGTGTASGQAGSAGSAAGVGTANAVSDAPGGTGSAAGVGTATAVGLGIQTWTLRGQSTHVVVAGTGVNNLTLPGPPQEDDVVVVACACDFALPAVGGSIGVNAASGYSDAGWPNDVNVGLQAGVKVMGGTPDTTVGVTARGGDNRSIVVVIQTWFSPDTTTPQDAVAVTAAGATGSPNAPSITTNTSSALVLAVGAADDQNTAASITAPAGYSNLATVEAGATAGESVTLAVASLTKASAGAEDPAAFGGATSDAWAAITIALRHSGGGGGQTGVGAQTLETPTQTASGTHALTPGGTGAQTVGALTQIGAAGGQAAGSATQTVPALSQASVASSANVGAQTLEEFIQTASAISAADATSTGAQTLEQFSQDGDATHLQDGQSQGAQTLPLFTQVAAGFDVEDTAILDEQNRPIQDQLGQQILDETGIPISAQAAQTLPAFTQTASGTHTLPAGGFQALAIFTQAGVGIIIGAVTGEAVWPVDLPQYPLVGSVNITQEDPRSIFEPDVGPPIIRRNRATAGEFLVMTFHMTDAQIASFRAFWRQTIAQGSGTFTITHPITDLTRSVRFVSPYAVRRRLADVNFVTVSLYMRPQ